MAYPVYPTYPMYGNYYPQSFQPATQPQMVQPQQIGQTMHAGQQGMNPAGMANQIQNGGFITVRSEAEARNYPVAPGTSVTFKHETAPYCYTKTMGFNQFEAPRFEKFRLVKEDDQDGNAPGTETVSVAFAKEEDLGRLTGVVQSMNEVVSMIRSDVDSLKSDVYGLAGKKKTVKKAEAEEDV